MKSELARRKSLEDQLYEFLLAHPRRWVHWYELAAHGGQAWRSRLPAIRQRFAALGYAVEWNKQNGNASSYRLREQPLGRDASQPVAQPGLW